jgi:hypothetical protein
MENEELLSWLRGVVREKKRMESTDDVYKINTFTKCCIVL